MKFRLLATSFAVTLALSGCASNSQSNMVKEVEIEQQVSQDDNRVFSQDYLLEELENGLRVMVVKTDYPDVVSLQIPVSVGSRNEVEAGKTGFAHFFEHMMFKGSEKFPQDVYSDILKNSGVDNRAYTTNDYTNYHLNFSKEHLDKVLEIEADIFQNLTYSEEQFRTEALTVKGEYLKNNASPIRKLLSAVRNEAFEKHTYKHTTMGFFEDIEAMPDQMAYGKEFFAKFYKPEYVSLVIVGDVDPQETMAMVKKHWGNWKKGDYQADIPTEPKQQAPKYVHEKYDGLPGHWLLVSYKGTAWDPTQKDRAALDLISQLYFSNNSALYQELVVDKQIASQMFTYNPDTKDPGLLHVFVKVENEADLAKARDAINRTYAQARTELVDAQKLADLKSNLKYSFINGLDSSQSIASTLASYMHFERDPEVINQLYATADSITPEDIKAVANKYFVDSSRTTVTMSALDKVTGFEQEVDLNAAVASIEQAPTERHFKVLDKTNSSPLVDVNWLFNTGAAADPQGKKGLAALTAAMLAQGGSESMSYKDIKKALYPLAGSFGYQLDKEMISLRGRVHKDNAAKWYALVSDQLLNPGFREDDFKRLKKELIDSIKAGLKASNDEELGKEVLYHQLYKGHPYESYNYGDISDLEALTLDDVKAFYNSQFTQSKLTVGLIGAIPSDVKSTMMKDLTQLPQGKESRLMIPDAPVLKGHHATIVEKSAQSTAVSFGFPIDTIRSSDDWTALWLVRSYFGEHRSSNSFLYQRIRQTRGMNYGDYAYIEYFPRGMFQTKPDANLGRSEQIFQVWLRPLRSNNDAHFATRTALFELDKLIKNGISKEDFEATRNFLINFVPQMVASQDRQLGYALDSEFYNTESFVDYVRGKLEKLTLDDVNRVIRDNLQTENIHYVFITGDGKDMQKRLASEQTSPMVYNAEKPAELVAEDKVIADYKLAIPAKNIKVLDVEKVFQ
ncbi:MULTISPECIES: M16 family metallopeptidase [unclassified Pseudoalteromonas]|uniref:M16 family metallopeptidase n=1 Tax=Pseudoalteromonas TaxID=53246 RepID=UPI001021067F|nr:MULTISPECIES: M16 family metallopeptidase [unclassified Pseudoalteromonas]MCG9707311.1 insulinase family protein [Pseudoalteromonas sp. Isolate3]MCP4586041.1 insulinase family protein [Pseudoalteromonas sp.]RZD21998.1 insulinase family protein [Pseudoalteromonas sp. MEBiC 03485]URQ89639.1 insulinase family protein [Pseudoalteromonas sp. SCSIO 43101]